MRVACVLIADLPVQAALKSSPELRDRPLVIGGHHHEGRPVLGASPAATACGLKVGMPMRQACALCPEAVFLPADEPGYRQAISEMCDLLESYSPLVEVDGPGCAYLDVTGLSDEETLARRMLGEVLADTGLSGSAGISGGKFFSRVAALTTTPEAPVVVPCGGEKDFVAPLSIDLLPCSTGIEERLHRLGIRSMGQLARLSLEALVAQFGREGARCHELANGRDGNPLTPRQKADTVALGTEIDPPAVICLRLLHWCQTLLEGPLRETGARGKACRELQVKVGFASGATREKRLAFREPTTSISTILHRIHGWLEGAAFPAPATGIQLRLQLTGERGRAAPLLAGRDGQRRRLREVAGDLRARFGYQPLKRVRETDPCARLPERRFSITDVQG